jgi:hypothetical protein
MPGPVIKAKLLKWGNSYGLRIAKADVERLGLQVGDELDFSLAGRHKVDISHIPSFDLGGIGPRHDEILNRERWKKVRRARRAK